MHIAGAWVGWGLGDVDPKVAWFKDKLRPRFSYARGLNSTEIFDEDLVEVVMTAQENWGMTPTGIIDWAFQKKAQWIAPPEPDPHSITGPDGTLYACQGTKPSTMWTGPQADVARALEDRMYFQPIFGPYEAFPMNNSINVEKQNLRIEIAERPAGDPINGIGFSQGAIVISEVYNEMADPGDPLHYRFKDWRKVWTIANPSRALGVENGNRYAGLPILGADKRGIMQETRRVKHTPFWWMDQGNAGDLYFDCENDDEGEFKEAICMVIMGNWTGGPNSIFRQVYEVAQRPLFETYKMMLAIMDAGLFFAGGIKPHLEHNLEPAKQFFRDK